MRQGAAEIGENRRGPVLGSWYAHIADRAARGTLALAESRLHEEIDEGRARARCVLGDLGFPEGRAERGFVELAKFGLAEERLCGEFHLVHGGAAVDELEELEERGKSVMDAVIEACRLRLRPILMTSIAFCAGVSCIAAGLAACSAA